MNELKVFIPEQKGLLIPDKPIRTIGIDLGTTNSTVAEAIFDPKNPDAIKVRCLDVDQVTEMGTDTDFLVPSVYLDRREGLDRQGSKITTIQNDGKKACKEQDRLLRM